MAKELEAFQWVEEVFGELLNNSAVQQWFGCDHMVDDMVEDVDYQQAVTAQYILWACLTDADRRDKDEWGSMLDHLTREDIVRLKEELPAIA